MGAREPEPPIPPAPGCSPSSAIRDDRPHLTGRSIVRLPAGRYLTEHGIERRLQLLVPGAAIMMIRGTFANIRLRNQLAPGTEGGFTRDFTEPDGPVSTVYDVEVNYARTGTPLLILAGTEYGSGSSRDWAAKGTALLGVRAVLAESYERIHRSNLIGMGVLPLQYLDGENGQSLGLTGEETFTITGVEALNEGVTPRTVTVTADNREFQARVRIDTPGEAAYYRHGGIMPYVLRSLL
jgi:aconitate hydratase